MILFIIIAVVILLATIFARTWLIDCIKRDMEAAHPVREVLKDIGIWLTANGALQLVNFLVVGFISMMVFIFLLCPFCPSETSHWEFNINALEDNLVTEGRFYGRRGYIDGELSYFYARPMSMGEKIEHIPADKTYIQYRNDEKPHVEVHQSKLDIPEWITKVFFVNWMNNKDTDYYILVVPEGTITNSGQYEIDMK